MAEPARVSSTHAPPPGTFDWLLSLRAHPQLRAWVLPASHGLGADARVLVVGCGDSTLSEDLWAEGCTRVVGVDIEARCVAAARGRAAGRAGLEWATVDVAAPEGLPPGLGAFDLALDKGTLDAIVCAGDRAACRAVWNVRGALVPGGVLVVVTLHRDGKVQRFLDAPSLGFASVCAHALSAPPAFDGKAIVCRAAARPPPPRGGAGGAAAFAAYYAEVARAPYEDATPLLTPEREASLRLLFGMGAHSLRGGGGGGPAGARAIGLAAAHELIFSPAERAEYDLTDFAQDAAAFEPALAGAGARWTADDAVAFLRAMQ